MLDRAEAVAVGGLLSKMPDQTSARFRHDREVVVMCTLDTRVPLEPVADS